VEVFAAFFESEVAGDTAAGQRHQQVNVHGIGLHDSITIRIFALTCGRLGRTFSSSIKASLAAETSEREARGLSLRKRVAPVLWSSSLFSGRAQQPTRKSSNGWR
jgi:hypothetical protein